MIDDIIYSYRHNIQISYLKRSNPFIIDYCNEIISIVEMEPQIASIPSVKEKLNMLKEVAEDYKEEK
ncbi:hypothetical protein JMM81_12695 [Bacillus sp. V3B]|uniref:hypothetical protein n=1 Tax=Bacillus sp. V3B TaxID=2804915 RepID=UPI00210B2A1A|nr:hypothetical protein [Bacillus sp. V3B]MCQ6275810.1 hypothetical protein [Bacillus sp. V3B]